MYARIKVEFRPTIHAEPSQCSSSRMLAAATAVSKQPSNDMKFVLSTIVSVRVRAFILTITWVLSQIFPLMWLCCVLAACRYATYDFLFSKRIFQILFSRLGCAQIFASRELDTTNKTDEKDRLDRSDVSYEDNQYNVFQRPWKTILATWKPLPSAS